MALSTKPDFDRVKQAWECFYAGEVLERPLVWAEAWVGKEKVINLRAENYWHTCHGEYEKGLAEIDHNLAQIEYLGESVPHFKPDHGTDQFSAFLGGELTFTTGAHNTNWIDPIIEDWEMFLPVRFDSNNKTYQSVLKYTRLMAEHGKGRYLVSPIDFHGHLDALSTLRGPQRLLMDLLECPDQVEEALKQLRPLYLKVYEEIARAGSLEGENGMARIVWAPGRFNFVQCDFIYMLGPDHFRQFALPGIRDEIESLDYSIFHLDGIAAFKHLDDLLAIPKLNVIQLVPGHGHPPQHEWMELIRKCLAAGKCVQMYGGKLTFDRIKFLHKELGPRRLVYYPSTNDRGELLRIMDWLKANT